VVISGWVIVSDLFLIRVLSLDNDRAIKLRFSIG